MLDSVMQYFHRLWQDVAAADYGVLLLCIIVIATMIVLDAVTLAISDVKRKTGIEPRAKGVSLDGSSSLPVRSYLSERQGLAGRPDALIEENGFIIPIERKPLARKVRDRYVAQLLVYMRLIEEFEGRKPPYGYLILGKNCRRVKVENTPERQAWVDQMLAEMRAVLHGLPAKPTPHPQKCAKCDVRQYCSAAMVERRPPLTGTDSTSSLKQIIR